MITQFEKQAIKIFKALADPTRYKIICLLAERTELSCGDFDREFDISKPALSNHYRILENANLTLTRKKGQHVIFSLNEEVLDRFLPQFRQIHLHQDSQLMEV